MWRILFIVLMLIAGCGTVPTTPKIFPPVTAKTPLEHLEGQLAYDTSCAGCHGKSAVGTVRGPSFFYRIYHPYSHSDKVFSQAIQHGTHAHHWRFGDMPKIDGLNNQQVAEIIAYIRWLQRQANIY